MLNSTVWVKAATLVARFNMCRVFTLTIVCATAIAVSSTSAQPVLSRYRGVTLGDPVQVVVDQLNVTSSDVKVVHERADQCGPARGFHQQLWNIDTRTDANANDRRFPRRARDNRTLGRC